MNRLAIATSIGFVIAISILAPPARGDEKHDADAHADHVHFSIQSVADGRWSNPATWKPPRIPGKGDRVLVSRKTRVEYDVTRRDVIRLLQVVGTLHFARDRDTELNVGVLKVQDSDTCSESGFACDFAHVNETGEPVEGLEGELPALLIGTPTKPIPPQHTARIRLHYLKGMDRNDAPAIACCSARMEIHGSPLSRTWVKLGADVSAGEKKLTLSQAVDGWRVGDEVIVTSSGRRGYGSFRPGASRYQKPQTEKRKIVAIEKGAAVTLDKPLDNDHSGAGEFRSEVANLSRNVIIESADPDGVRGHTVYHRFSRGGVSYARFAHLGKEGVLGRYAIHYHLVGDTMRGSSLRGVSIVDSHNRWITIHGTQYLVVRDCVGYGSVGHGFFMEDGTEVYNLLDRNLGVHAYRGRRLPEQVLPFDQNRGAAFWWANGRNTITRNIGVESDQYGFRYDMQNRSNFDSRLPILQPDGEEREVDVRTIPIWRFEGNESHGNFAGMVVAANGGSQPDVPIRSESTLQRLKRVDWTGPDTRHPHVIRDFKIWRAHYAIRLQSPAMLIDGLRIHDAAYGVYRPSFENQVYRNLHLSGLGPEPFNRGMDDASAQVGSITVDGLKLDHLRGGNQRHPFVHMTDNAFSEGAACHFRNIEVLDRSNPRRPLFNLGGSTLAPPFVDTGVPYYVHDHFGPGRDAKIVSTEAKDLIGDGSKYVEQRPITGDESRIAEVGDVQWPQLLDPIDDVPPATVITSVTHKGGELLVSGVTHDNGEVMAVTLNKKTAEIVSRKAGVVDWRLRIARPVDGKLTAYAKDDAGNVERTAHRTTLSRLLVADAPTRETSTVESDAACEEAPATGAKASNIRLFEWGKGIGVQSREREDMRMYLWFYEWNMFDAREKGVHTGGTHMLEREVSEDGSRAVVRAPDMRLTMEAVRDGVQMQLEIKNRTTHVWPEIAGVIPCFNPGSPKGQEKRWPHAPLNSQFNNRNTWYLGQSGLEKQDRREIHFNRSLRNQVDSAAIDGKHAFSFKWPTSAKNAKAGLMIRESTDGKWVTGIAWDAFLSTQGHNPWACMHLCVNVGPLKPRETKKINGRIFLFQGDKEDCLKRNHAATKASAKR